MGKLFPKNITFSHCFLPCLILAVGGFYEFISAIAALVLCVFLLVKLQKQGKLLIRVNLLSISVFTICGFYGLCAFWAVDKGMAVIGFVKYLPLALFFIALGQDKQQISQVLSPLPRFTAGLVIVFSALAQIPKLHIFFTVTDRLSGCFQYPNTFALLILVSQLLLFRKETLKLWDWVTLLILVLGLLYTGSRTVFVLFLAANAVFLVLKLRKTDRRAVLGILWVLLVPVVLVLLLTKGHAITRLFHIRLWESAFLSRLLFITDALPLVLRYPLGSGYLGYNYLYHSIQTGVYTTRFVHNDFLQLLLDVGSVPLLLLLACVAKAVFSKKTDGYTKCIILVMCAHGFLDFDFQFLSIFLIFLLLLDTGDGKTVALQKGWIPKLSLCLTGVFSLYMAICLVLSHFCFYSAAHTLYPWNTESKLQLLQQEPDLNRANELSTDILSRNAETFIPYTVKASYAYCQGDFTAVIENQRMVLEKNPFYKQGYEDYCRMLINGISLYQAAQDSQSAAFCQQELLRTVQLLQSSTQRLSFLGSRITQQPDIQLPEDIQDALAKLE